MKLRCVLILIGVIALGAYVVKRFTKKLYDGISYSGASLKFNNINTYGVNVTVMVQFRNDNSINIPINYFTGYLYYSGARLASLQSSPVVLNAGSVTTMFISSKINFVDLGTDLVNTIINKSFSNDFRIIGDINIKGITTSIDYPILSQV